MAWSIQAALAGVCRRIGWGSRRAGPLAAVWLALAALTGCQNEDWSTMIGSERFPFCQVLVWPRAQPPTVDGQIDVVVWVITDSNVAVPAECIDVTVAAGGRNLRRIGKYPERGLLFGELIMDECVQSQVRFAFELDCPLEELDTVTLHNTKEQLVLPFRDATAPVRQWLPFECGVKGVSGPLVGSSTAAAQPPQ